MVYALTSSFRATDWTMYAKRHTCRTQYHVHLARRLPTLLHLARALVIDLRLNREFVAPDSHDQTQRTPWVYSKELPSGSQHTLEERRAFLGLIYLTSLLVIIRKAPLHRC